MILYALGGMLLGGMLGTLTVAAIIPAVLMVLVIAGAVTAVGGESFGPKALEFALLVITLQIGYLLGAGIRFSLYRRREGQHLGFSSNRPTPK